jgi:hypothetical protein
MIVFFVIFLNALEKNRKAFLRFQEEYKQIEIKTRETYSYNFIF